MTADHTPERLSGDERESIRVGLSSYLATFNEVIVMTRIERILTARLADQAARLAETLAEVGIELRRSVIDGSFSLVYPEGIRAALHPDASEARRCEVCEQPAAPGIMVDLCADHLAEFRAWRDSRPALSEPSADA